MTDSLAEVGLQNHRALEVLAAWQSSTLPYWERNVVFMLRDQVM